MKEKRKRDRIKPRTEKDQRKTLAWSSPFLREEGGGEINLFLKDFGEKKPPCCAC